MDDPIELVGIKLLKTYTGDNDYILYLKKQCSSKKRTTLTKTEAGYVINNFKLKPAIINRDVELYKSCGPYLQKKHGLSFIPKKIFINKLLYRNDDILHIWGSFDEDRRYHESIYLEKSCIKDTRIKIGNLDFTPFERQPLEHQIPAIKALLENNRFILGDDMGLAKTSSAILAAILGNFQRILVVCPASLKINWKKEIIKYDDNENVTIVNGGRFDVNKWTIINYDILKYYHYEPRRGVKIDELPPSQIDMANFDLIIADEAHYLKSASSARSKIFYDFSHKIKNVWLLTGTPITNKPIDFFHLLKIVKAPFANDWFHFIRRYCDARQIRQKGTSRKIWLSDGASNLEELRDFSSEFMLRRLKEQVLTLPEKLVEPIYLSREDCPNYDGYLKQYADWVEEMREKGEEPKLSDHLVKLITVRQILSLDKIPHTIKVVEDLIENGHKVVIFSCFTNSITQLYEHFNKSAVLIDGSTSQTKRDQAIVDFQTNKNIKVFCGNIIAAGVGTTLTEGSVVVFNDLDWVPTNHAQAEDRIHRIGQQNKTNILYMLFDDTLDTIIYDVLRDKMKTIRVILGDENEEQTLSVIKTVVNKLTT